MWLHNTCLARNILLFLACSSRIPFDLQPGVLFSMAFSFALLASAGLRPLFFPCIIFLFYVYVCVCVCVKI